jgi:NAD(P)-dependent dehydrogenase (short-subunit alcohol dehydrogenase family)
MADMKGKTVLISGANQGIGKASAIALGQKGAKLVIVCRNEEKARAAMADMDRAGAKDVELVVADLSSQAEVRRVAAEFKAKHDRLDVLLNNAGVLVTSFRTTVDGIEETFALNHLGYFLLTNLLLDVIKASAESSPEGARIVSVSSEAHRSAKHVRWEDLQYKNGYSSFGAYGQSKLCNILFTRELARRLEGTRVTANCLHPGLVASGFGQTYGGFMSVLIKLGRPFMISTEEGAETQVYLSSSPDVQGISGKYFAKCKERTPSKVATDDAAARKLWAVSEEMTGLRGKAVAA